MKEKLLDLLACPTCGGDISLAYASKYEEKEIIEGVLTCAKCTREYRVVRGVPRFADLEKIETDKAETAENFGWQWTHFTQEDIKYADQFLGWMQPVKPEFFKDKIVLEGGCGKGRHTSLAANCMRNAVSIARIRPSRHSSPPKLSACRRLRACINSSCRRCASGSISVLRR